MEYDQFNAAEFKKDEPAVSYVGTKTTKGFKIKETIADTSVSGEYTYYNFTVKLDRVYTDQLIVKNSNIGYMESYVINIHSKQTQLVILNIQL